MNKEKIAKSIKALMEDVRQLSVGVAIIAVAAICIKGECTINEEMTILGSSLYVLVFRFIIVWLED